MIVCDIRSASNFVDFFVTVLADIGLIAAIQIRIVLWPHIAAAAPVFVSYAKEFHFPRIFMAIFSAKISHRRNAIHRDVFHPFRHFLHRSAADIAVDIRVTFQLLDQFKKFMGPEMIVFSHAAPVSVDHRFAVFFRSNSVFPRVFIGEAAAWPTQHRDLNVFQCFNHIDPHPIFIWDLRIFSNV